MSETPILRLRIDTAHIPAAGLEAEVVAGDAEREALAEAYGLVAVNALAATVTLTAGRRGSVTVEGRVTADIVQSCVVTLEPVAQQINEAFSVRFVAPGSVEAPAPPKAGAEVVVDPAAPDPPEVLDGDSLDLGALVEEHFALAIDPYPRAPGAAVPVEIAAPPEPPGESPFAVLARTRTPGK